MTRIQDLPPQESETRPKNVLDLRSMDPEQALEELENMGKIDVLFFFNPNNDIDEVMRILKTDLGKENSIHDKRIVIIKLGKPQFDRLSDENKNLFYRILTKNNPLLYSDGVCNDVMEGWAGFLSENISDEGLEKNKSKLDEFLEEQANQRGKTVEEYIKNLVHFEVIKNNNDIRGIYRKYLTENLQIKNINRIVQDFGPYSENRPVELAMEIFLAGVRERIDKLKKEGVNIKNLMIYPTHLVDHAFLDELLFNRRLGMHFDEAIDIDEIIEDSKYIDGICKKLVKVLQGKIGDIKIDFIRKIYTLSRIFKTAMYRIKDTEEYDGVGYNFTDAEKKIIAKLKLPLDIFNLHAEKKKLEEILEDSGLKEESGFTKDLWRRPNIWTLLAVIKDIPDNTLLVGDHHINYGFYGLKVKNNPCKFDRNVSEYLFKISGREIYYYSFNYLTESQWKMYNVGHRYGLIAGEILEQIKNQKTKPK